MVLKEFRNALLEACEIDREDSKLYLRCHQIRMKKKRLSGRGAQTWGQDEIKHCKPYGVAAKTFNAGIQTTQYLNTFGPLSVSYITTKGGKFATEVY